MRRIKKLTPLFVITVFTLFSCKKGERDFSAPQINVKEIQSAGRKTSYPSYNTNPLPPDATGMPSTAVQLASKFKLGINIGNTLEAIGGETAWGNPQVTQALIDKYKQSGFTSVRIPCSWDQYANQSTGKISDQWMARVKQVVQYCVNDGMYVVLNIHWDGGWLENNITTRAQSSVNAKQKAYWEQIATAMRDFDEHVMFASANEPNASDATAMSVLLSYHQTFINAVRSTGGHNTYRTLVIQGPSTNIDYTNNLMNTLPTDPTANRMMVEIHYYEPFQFTALSADASWGNMFYYWGQNYHSTIEPSRNATWGEEDFVVAEFPKMKAKFVDKGIPVIVGEYGAYRRTTPLDMDKHQASVDHWITFVTQQEIANGLKPFWWDTGGMISRSNYTVLDQRTLNAILLGGQ
ncbi:MAG TPA: glycoside hydrolase family 5 protein [Chitinophagaceae bacterium]|jgi:aryl-phospho-beta-D-glucosidase BglC (GH1 family)|nr:glycoside hydrolase family 5 protein [Chitinophagaceae bacterium]